MLDTDNNLLRTPSKAQSKGKGKAIAAPLSDSEENPFTAQGGAGCVSVCLNGNVMLMLL